jgi:hypothetical protein
LLAFGLAACSPSVKSDENISGQTRRGIIKVFINPEYQSNFYIHIDGGFYSFDDLGSQIEFCGEGEDNLCILSPFILHFEDKLPADLIHSTRTSIEGFKETVGVFEGRCNAALYSPEGELLSISHCKLSEDGAIDRLTYHTYLHVTEHLPLYANHQHLRIPRQRGPEEHLPQAPR